MSLELLNWQKIFQQLPVALTIFKANDSDYIMIDATDYHLLNVKIKRDDFIGRKMFDLFPDVSGNKEKVKECIKNAVDSKSICKSEIIRYDIPVEETGKYETKYWTLDFSPIIGDTGEVEFVVQHSMDITNLINLGFNPK